jgi:uncharacterized protein (TIGR03000 family)
MTGQWIKRLGAACLVLMGLAGAGPPTARAEIRYDGGFIITHPERYHGSRIIPQAGPLILPQQIPHVYRSYLYAPGPMMGVPLVSRPAEPTFAIPPLTLPWHQAGYEGYDEPERKTQDSAVLLPIKYTLEATALPASVQAPSPDVALLVVHLPADAPLWIDGKLTQSTGQTRYLVSPPLEPGKKYHYTGRVLWYEEGQWVGQTLKVPVRAGGVEAVYLTLSPQARAQKQYEAAIEANLAKLGPEDQKIARQQKICAVRTDRRLGEMGVPIKVMIKGHPVFVCEEACVKKALAEPDKTWELAKQLQAGPAAQPPGR